MRPQGIYVDERRYYIADPGAARVTVIERKTMDVFHIIEAKEEEISYPKSVVADAEGNIYVADSDLRQVMVFSPDGKYLFVQNSLLNLPGMDDGSITVIDVAQGKATHSINTLKDAGYNPNCIVLLPAR